MFFYVVSTQVPTGTPARIRYTDGTISTFAASSPAFSRVPETGTITVTSASCTGCAYNVYTKSCPDTNITVASGAAPNVALEPATPPAPPSLPLPDPGPVAAAPPAMNCFSGDSLVRLDDGSLKRMDELETNEWVLAVEGSRVSQYSTCMFFLSPFENHLVCR